MRVGRVLGCSVAVSPWTVAALAGYGILGQLAPALLAFVLLVTHELAHLVVARGFGLEVEEIELWPFGGIARVRGLEAAEPAVVALVAAAGPLNHFLLLGVGELLAALGMLHPTYGPWFLEANLILGTVNLLPGLPLDGGRILQAYLRASRGERDAVRLALIAGYVTAGGMVAGAAVAAVYGLLLPDLAALAVVVAAGARREASRAAAWALRPLWRRRQELARTGRLPLRAVAARADLPLKDVIGELRPRTYLLVWVLDERLRTLGVLDEGRLQRALLEGRFGASLGDLLDQPPPGR